MDNDPYRAALAVACVFAVVLGASLFPATGFGTNPVPAGGIANGSGGGSGGPGGGPGDAGTTTDLATTAGESTTTSTADGATTSASDPTTTTAASGSDGSNGSDAPSRTATTATTTTTASPAYEESSEGGLQGALLAFVTILVGSGLTVVLGAVGLGRHHRRRHPGEWDLPSAPHLRVLEYVRRIPQTSLSFVMFAGTNAPGIIDGLSDGVGNATAGLGAATAGLTALGSSLGRGLASVPGGLVRGIGSLGRGIGSIALGLGAFSSLGSDGLFAGGADRPSDDPRGGASETPAAEPDPEPPEPPSSVREAFDRLQEDLGVSGRDGETPGEIARHAIDRGLPSDAVRSLTTTFRDVRYGGHPDEGERVSVARDAYERVRRALTGESS